MLHVALLVVAWLTMPAIRETGPAGHRIDHCPAVRTPADRAGPTPRVRGPPAPR